MSPHYSKRVLYYTYFIEYITAPQISFSKLEQSFFAINYEASDFFEHSTNYIIIQ